MPNATFNYLVKRTEYLAAHTGLPLELSAQGGGVAIYHGGANLSGFTTNGGLKEWIEGVLTGIRLTEKKLGEKVRVLVDVSGGVVAGIHASPPARCEVRVLDRDNAQEASGENPELQIWFAGGQTAAAFLQQVGMNNPNYETLL